MKNFIVLILLISSIFAIYVPDIPTLPNLDQDIVINPANTRITNIPKITSYLVVPIASQKYEQDLTPIFAWESFSNNKDGITIGYSENNKMHFSVILLNDQYELQTLEQTKFALNKKTPFGIVYDAKGENAIFAWNKFNSNEEFSPYVGVVKNKYAKVSAIQQMDFGGVETTKNTTLYQVSLMNAYTQAVTAIFSHNGKITNKSIAMRGINEGDKEAYTTKIQENIWDAQIAEGRFYPTSNPDSATYLYLDKIAKEQKLVGYRYMKEYKGSKMTYISQSILAKENDSYVMPYGMIGYRASPISDDILIYGTKYDSVNKYLQSGQSNREDFVGIYKKGQGWKLKSQFSHCTKFAENQKAHTREVGLSDINGDGKDEVLVIFNSGDKCVDFESGTWLSILEVNSSTYAMKRTYSLRLEDKLKALYAKEFVIKSYEFGDYDGDGIDELLIYFAQMGSEDKYITILNIGDLNQNEMNLLNAQNEEEVEEQTFEVPIIPLDLFGGLIQIEVETPNVDADEAPIIPNSDEPVDGDNAQEIEPPVQGEQTDAQEGEYDYGAQNPQDEPYNPLDYAEVVDEQTPQEQTNTQEQTPQEQQIEKLEKEIARATTRGLDTQELEQQLQTAKQNLAKETQPATTEQKPQEEVVQQPIDPLIYVAIAAILGLSAVGVAYFAFGKKR